MKKKHIITIYSLILMGFVMIFANSCTKDDNNDSTTGVVPVLTTAAVSGITQTTASCGGNITSDGGSTITAYGVCWSTGSTPTITDSKTTDGTGTGSFTSSLTGLTANTTYYVRAYATNTTGTGYGTAVSFTTTQGSTNTVTDINGNIYHTVVIGTQTWMVENLKVTKYRNGDSIANTIDGAEWSNLTSGGYCIFDGVSANVAAYGLLYNWYAVSDSRNICPTGWHIPTDAEWTTLTTFLGGESVAGAKLKETGTTHWNSPNSGATNSSGFTGLPGGSRDQAGTFSYLTYFGFWWSATESDSNNAWYKGLTYNSPAAGRNANPKKMGFSVRCVKD
ncbi:MAG: hypothetical protein HGB12_05505 [Bacteroidetes bacterium]|nr:hypothetical protein [Bacteroidota bacterium]